MKKQLQSILSLGTVTTLGVAAIISSNCSAETTMRDSVTATIEQSCSMLANVDSAHSATISGGSYSSNIGQTTFSIYCNGAHGWRLNAIGYSDDTLGDTNMYSSGKASSIATGTATSGDSSAWAMKLSAVSGSYAPTITSPFGSYANVPNSSVEVATGPTTDVGTGASGSKLTSTYQAYVSQYQAAGNYTGKVKYTLYAVTPPQTLSTITNMQDMTSEICAASAENETNQLKDTRDNKLYWVTKLADGNCWMTQNLDYDIKADGTDIIATIGGGTTTTWNSSYPAYATETALSNHTEYTDTYSWDPGDYYVANGGSSSACTTWRPSSTCQGTTKLSYDLISADAKGKEELHYHLGNYYQWNTATAGYGGTNTSTDINYSICPKGWRLPTSNSYTNNYSFGKLTNAHGITNSATGSSDADLIKSPLWFVRAGRVDNGRLYSQGTYGYVFSSRAYSSTRYAYYLYFRSTSVNPSNYNARIYGYSVRCVAE